MGKRKIDRKALIGSRLNRNMAYCKRRRGLLKKAIEMSRMCDTRVFLVVHDPDKEKAVLYQSDESFTFVEAYKAVLRARKIPLHNQFEEYTNDDYQMLENCDMRTKNKRGRPQKLQPCLVTN